MQNSARIVMHILHNAADYSFSDRESPLCSFLLVNSVALHGDGCPICQSVEKELIKLSRDLICSLQVGGNLGSSHFLTATASQALCSQLSEMWIEVISTLHARSRRQNFFSFFLNTRKVFCKHGWSTQIWNHNIDSWLRTQTADEFFIFFFRILSPPAKGLKTVMARRPTLPPPPSCYR